MSPEVNAGWHAKTEANRANSDRVARPSTEYTYAYELHLALMATPRGLPTARFIMGISLDRPGCQPAQNAIKIMKSIKARGYPTGRVIVDRGYSQKANDAFHRPARGLHYDPVMDYPRTELGVQGTYAGMFMLGGAYYCPGTPQSLRTLYVDRESGTIDDDTFQRRLAELQLHRMRPKSRWTPESTSLTFRCPAAGPRPLAHCPNKDRAGDRLAQARGDRRALPVIALPPTDVPPVCTNKDSTSVPVTKLPKQYQTLAYLTEEWLNVYKPGRSQNEGVNGYIKDGAHTDIANAGQFRFRGYAKRLIATAVVIAAANLRILRAHFARPTTPSAPPTQPPPQRGRPRAETFASRREPEHGPPNIAARTARENDVA